MSSSPLNLPTTATLRPTSGKILTVVIGAFAAVGLFSFIYRGIPRDAVQYGLLAAAFVYLCWLLFWFPSVTVEPSGVTVRNVAVIRQTIAPRRLAAGDRERHTADFEFLESGSPSKCTTTTSETIDGKPVDGIEFFDVINPATASVFARAPDASRAQLDQAV